MTIKIKTIGLLLLTTGQIAFGQTNTEIALAKGQEAIKLEDEGKFDDAIRLLEEAQKLDPDRISYPYELGYAYYSIKDYKKCANYLEGILNHKNAYDQIFQLLGDCYDDMGKTDKALETFDAGLKLFPNSGKLYLEKGNVYGQKGEYQKALPFYEQGIEVDPTYPSNYYRAAIIYCSTSEKIWGVLYGEIFMNLERNSERTAEISELLYETYKSSIYVKSDTSGGVDFSKVMTIDINKKFKVPFQMDYGITMTMGLPLSSMNKEKILSLSSIDKIRTYFIKNWFALKRDINNPNILFDFNQILLKEGHYEAYNHWIFMKGNESEFNSWLNSNKDKWDTFVKWFGDNNLNINDSNKFYSGQY